MQDLPEVNIGIANRAYDITRLLLQRHQLNYGR